MATERLRGEKNHHRLAQCVGGVHSDVEHRIVDAPPRTLLPVDNAGTVRIR